MTIIKIIEGDLLNAKETILCQQCNCVTMLSHGLTAQVAKKFPWADVYKRRKPKTANCTSEPSIPGTIQIDHDPEEEYFEGKTIIHMFGQWLPGIPGKFYPAYQDLPKVNDGSADRIKYFKECLQKLDALKLPVPVAMPYKIGCGLAGGNWPAYQKMLEEARTKIVLYKFD